MQAVVQREVKAIAQVLSSNNKKPSDAILWAGRTAGVRADSLWAPLLPSVAPQLINGAGHQKEFQLKIY